MHPDFEPEKVRAGSKEIEQRLMGEPRESPARVGLLSKPTEILKKDPQKIG